MQETTPNLTDSPTPPNGGGVEIDLFLEFRGLGFRLVPFIECFADEVVVALSTVLALCVPESFPMPEASSSFVPCAS